MSEQAMIKAEKTHYNRTKNLLRTAVAATAISIPLIHTSTSDAAGFARRGGFRQAPAFHENFHPQFRQNFNPQPRANFHPQFRENFHPQFRQNFNPQPRANFHPQFRENFHPQFRQNFNPQFRENFHPQFRQNFQPQFHDFDRFNGGFRYNYNRDWDNGFQPFFGLNFNYGYGYNSYNYCQPYSYSYPSYSYPVYNYPSYAYSSPAYSYPVQTYAYPQVYVPQAQSYVAADPPAAQAPVLYPSQASPTYAPQAGPDPIILTYPNLQVIVPGRKTTLADVENLYATGRLNYSQEQRVISDMHLNPVSAVSATSAKSKNSKPLSVSTDDVSSAKRLLNDGYISEKQYAEILAKKTLESDAAKMYANGSFTKAEYEKMLAKIKRIPTDGQPGDIQSGQTLQSK